ncbi:MAG: hypothetical protein ABIO67_06835 [Mycobacteriales bacterium]
MISPDDVQLTDLKVIQRYSIAVRGAVASRDEVIATLTADLEWLRGGGRRRTPAAAAPTKVAKAPAKNALKATKSGARKA